MIPDVRILPPKAVAVPIPVATSEAKAAENAGIL